MNRHDSKRENAVNSAAMQYLGIGWSVLGIRPARPGDRKSGKHPFGAWRHLIAAAPEAESVLHDIAAHPRCNLAAVCGRRSRIIVADADGAEALTYLQATVPATPLVCRTGKGEHHYFAWPGFEVRPRTRVNGLPLDIRGDGSYIVVPPSQHYSGRRYEWVTPPTVELLRQLPPFDPKWFAEEGTGRRSKITVSPVESRLRVVRRAMRYVDRMPPAVSGERGHDALFRVVCKLLRTDPDGFGLTESEALPIIAAYNARCLPPFSDREVDHKIQSVLSKLCP
jgi:hypothetical protein